MSATLDRTYINYLSSRIEKFKWIRPNLARAKCPLCGDGSHNKHRFYVLPHKEKDALCIKCHNCGIFQEFRFFLEAFDQTLYQEYRVESFKEYFGDKYVNYSNKKKEQKQEKKPVETKPDTEIFARSVITLPEDHTCRKYVVGRKIPFYLLSKLYYHDDYREFCSKYVPEDVYDKIPSDPRLIIPFFDFNGKLKAFQGRSLDPFCKMRYITIKLDDNNDKIYGEERVDRSKEVRVVEGPIDSMFIKNCVASADADLTKVTYGNVYIPDNQYRNKEIVKRIEKMISQGCEVVLFPKNFAWKDINDAITKGGYSMDDIENIINNNKFSGLRAKMRLAEIRKL